MNMINRAQGFRTLKQLRILSQVLFFGLFLFIFIRSLNPFWPGENPFLKTDPLILLTHLQFEWEYLVGTVGILALTVVFGRFFCGWICPLGTLIEILDFCIKPLRKSIQKRLFHDKSIHDGSFHDGSFVKITHRFAHYPPSWFILSALLVAVFYAPPVLQFFHPNVWIIRIFSLSLLGIMFLGLLVVASLFSRRFWCSYVCPLGALYGLLAKVSVFKLLIKKCSACSLCDTCPMKAAEYSSKTVINHQCILCFEYESRCPASGFQFAATRHDGIYYTDETRRALLVQGALFAGGLLTGTLLILSGRGKKGTPQPDATPIATGSQPDISGLSDRMRLFRPPGVTDDNLFVQRCLRCFQCVQSCPNKIIKISGLEGGFNGVFTPHLVFEEFGCDYNCQVCQLVCPNFAIPKQTLAEKQHAVIGIAAINEKRCVVFAEDTNCLVCEEFCPIPDKAIKVSEKTKLINGVETVLRYPIVQNNICIGCGICETNCPTAPRSITVKIA